MQKKPSDPDVYRFLGGVKYGLKDYEGSAAAFRMSATVSGTIDFEVLRGLTNALIAAKKPDETKTSGSIEALSQAEKVEPTGASDHTEYLYLHHKTMLCQMAQLYDIKGDNTIVPDDFLYRAVQMLLASRKSLKDEKTSGSNDETQNSSLKSKSEVEPIQVDLLLGKAYSEWGHVSDAVSVYNQLISTYPDDFRGYLAKGIILKENGNVGDAERMFIQARFFAPEKAKALVDKYSKRLP
ncbi:auxin-responsive family protein [Capsicum annuum]|nr:auxin-responsive family protein [Capsicum annuum]